MTPVLKGKQTARLLIKDSVRTCTNRTSGQSRTNEAAHWTLLHSKITESSSGKR